MRRVLLVALCASTMILLAAFEARAENSWGIVVSGQPRGEDAPITLHLPATGKQLHAQLYARRTEATPRELTSVRFFAVLTQQGSPAGKITITGRAPAADSSASITLPADGSPILLNVTIDEVNVAERYEAELIAEWQRNGQAAPQLESVARITIQPRPQLRIAGSPASGPITLVTPSAAFDRRLEVESINGGSVQQLEVVASPLVGGDGTVAQLTVTSASDNRELGPVTLDGLKSLPLRIQSTLPKAQDYTGQISLIFDGKRDTFDLKVTRTKPVLQIVGAPATGPLKLSSEQAEFVHQFVLTSSSSAPIEDVRVVVSDLNDPESGIVKVNWQLLMPTESGVKIPNGAAERTDARAASKKNSGYKKLTTPIRLDAMESCILELRAKLVETGEHSGSIQLLYDGEKTVYGYTVNRKRPEPNVEILGGGTSYGTAYLFRKNEVHWWFTLHEKSGKRATVTSPELVELYLETPNKAILQAFPEKVEITERDGKPVVEPIDLQPGEIRLLCAKLHHLRGAGVYKGMLRVGVMDGQSLAKDVAIFIRTSGCSAALLILAGVVISFGLREYYSRAQPQLLRQERAILLQQEINQREQSLGNIDDLEGRVMQVIRSRMNDLVQSLDSKDSKEFDAIHNDIDQKLTVLPEWVNVRRKLNAARPPEAVESLKAELDAVTNYLLEGSTDDSTKEHRKTLANIERQIPQKLKAFFKDELTAFRKEVEALPTGQLTADQLTELDDVKLDINQAERALEEQGLEAAQRQLDKSRGTFVIFNARLLSDELAKPNVPYGFDAQEWTKIENDILVLINDIEVIAATNPEAARDRYQLAFKKYLVAVLDRLRQRINEKKQQVAQQPLTPQTKQLLDDLEDCLKEIRVAKQQVEKSKFTEALQAYGTVLQKYKALVPPNVRAAAFPAGLKSGGGIGLSLKMPVSVTSGLVSATPVRTPKRLLTIDEIRRRRLFYDVLLMLIAIVIATLLGLKILWASAPTWGSWDDCLTALLWGLGLHQVTASTAFGGAQWIQSQYATKPANQ